MNNTEYLKCLQRVERMKASLVGFIRCRGLKGPSESHLIKVKNQKTVSPTETVSFTESAQSNGNRLYSSLNKYQL